MHYCVDIDIEDLVESNKDEFKELLYHEIIYDFLIDLNNIRESRGDEAMLDSLDWFMDDYRITRCINKLPK
ncbi:hypothetical protein [Moraxella sp. ZY200743]|uniref:hypothetical protein n=1 Tax=Moraxella sp. ZY200743 TaxID=2911970 RepID=UPI003D7DA940